MILEILNHKYQYEAEKLLRIFFPNEKITVVFQPTEKADDEMVISTECTENTIQVRYAFGDTTQTLCAPRDSLPDAELVLATLLFRVLTAQTGYTPKWGILTGIRPSKLLIALQEKMGVEDGNRWFTERCFVSPEKAALAYSVAAREAAILRTSRPDSCSLYVSIPFCPTRCSYCSFISSAMTGQAIQKLVPDYVRLLTREIEETGRYAKTLGLRLESVYFGGGTPTTLSAQQLCTLLDAVARAFDLGTVREYTVEAGRPDTVTLEKLSALRDGGVTRVSINPQSFNDAVLQKVGRQHTAAMTERAYLQAREVGFSSINMDLIAGLPTESVSSFSASIDKTLQLAPENITVHTLALKRSSVLGTNGTTIKAQSENADQMLQYAYDALTREAYFPYYMYRQAKTLGNLENTGYAKDGHACLYNIFMMEECHTVFAVGAGAVTKLKAPNQPNIQRIFNYKYPYEYIAGFDELLKRKEAIFPFYAAYA